MSYGIIGFACDFGGSVEGTREGPRTLRDRGLAEMFARLNLPSTDLGDASVTADIALPKFSEGERRCKRVEEVFRACADLERKTRGALAAGLTPIILGGDHSLSIGSVAGVSNHFAAQNKRIGLIWVDAHSDINTPDTTPSGNFFGMSVAVLAGLMPGGLQSLQKKSPAVQKNNIAFVGLRDVDPGEKEIIRSNGIFAATMKDIDKNGAAWAIERAIETAAKDTAGFVVSFDLDACDPHFAPGTGTPKRGGLTYREAHLVLELLCESKKMVSFELVEFNPRLDRNFETADVAVSLLESALGKSIL